MASQATDRWARERALALTVLAGTALTAASCSSVENPNLGGLGGTAGSPAGTGGTTSPGGAPRGSSNCVDQIPVSCVASCNVPDHPVEDVCENGAWRCPDGSVAYASCPAWSCARWDSVCCDRVTGEHATPDCGSDGYRVSCAAGSRAITGSYCIPDDLGITDCSKLHGKSCATERQECWSYLTTCKCTPADGGLAWSCATLLI
jgi:hypothetical protein